MKRRIIHCIAICAVIATVCGFAIAWYLSLNPSEYWLRLIIPLSVLAVLIAVLAYIFAGFLVKPIEEASSALKKGEKADLDRLYDELLDFEELISVQKTEIREQQRRIEDESNKLNAIIRNMSEGLILLDGERNILMANESARKYLRTSTGLNSGSEMPIAKNADFNRCVDAAYAGQDMYVFIQQAGRQLQVIANPVIKDAEQAGIICLILDVTEKMEIQRMKQEFTANVSHELKTPLTSISGYAEMIENGMATGEHISNFAGRIRRESSRLLTLISDIIKLSELDESENLRLFQPVNILSVAQECREILSYQADRQKVEIIVEGRGGSILGDKDMLEELVYNLCDNAIRYNRENGIVRIIAENNAITVADTGIGIPEEHQSFVFERFYRVDKSRSKQTGGTGLGLAIVKHIAELHKASIELTSTPGEGTQIKVSFPTVPDKA